MSPPSPRKSSEPKSPDENGSRANQLFSELYPQLRRSAAACLVTRPSHTLQATALVHEAWLRLLSRNVASRLTSVEHVYAAASRTMRHILIDHSRKRLQKKRGGDLQRVSLDAAEEVPLEIDEKLIRVNEAISRLEKVHPIRAKVVILKFFGGLANSQVAREMSLGERTVERYWNHAKLWLYDEIAGSSRDSEV